MKRAFWQGALPLMLCVFFAACPAYCSTYFVDPNGNDSNVGDINHPFKTIPHAVGVVAAGDTIYVRGGTHTYTATITLSSKSGSSPTNRCSLIGYNGERPLLDFSAMADGGSDGLKLSGSYWYVKGIDCKGAPHSGIRISGGTYNIVEFCRTFQNRNAGTQLNSGAAYNQIINCDSYYNYDAPTNGGNADGFAIKMDVGTDNYLYGCRSWQNSDDGYDGYLRGADDVNTTYEKCWSFKNGWYWLDGSTTTSMNGNGFKMGGSDDKTLRHNATLKNCLSFQNKAKGFDQNNNKGSMTLYNCTSFSNNMGNISGGAPNFSIPSVLASGKTATVTNGVSFTGTVSLGSFVVQTTDSWIPPFVVTSADFVNIDPCSAYGVDPCSVYGARNADGSLPDINFMHLVAGSDLINGGTYVGLPYHGTAPDLGYFEYGGCTTPLASDLNGDCEVDFFDYALFADAWGSNPPEVDLNNDGHLDFLDIAQFAIEWLTCNRDPSSECWQQ
jgi:Right handed beta helix region